MAQADSAEHPRDRRSRSRAGAAGPRRAPRATDQPSRRRAPATELRLRRGFLWWGRNAFVLGVIVLAWQVLLIARGVVSALLAIVLLTMFAAVVSLLCGPAAALLRRRARLPSTLAALLTLAMLVGAVAGIVWLVAPPLVAEGRHLAAELPGFQDRLNALSASLHHIGFDVGTLSLKGMVNGLLGSGSGVGGVLVGAVTSTLAVIADIVVVLVAAFWFLRDGDLLRHLVIDSLPAAWRPHLDFGLRAFAVVIGGYVRGQVVMAVMVGTMAGLGSALIGVPFPLVVAAAAGFFELIPLVGPFVGGAVAGLLALSVSPTLVIWVVALFLGIHLLEGYVIAPRLQARYVRLHPVVAFLALFAGIFVAGFLGALIAVPLASLAAVYLQAVLGDVRAARPELFESSAVRAESAVEERRHRELLRKYRIRYREALRGLIKRLHITL